MVISYNWLKEYLPITPEPEKLSQILTSIGLEVESMSTFESVRGGLKGLIVGEVMHCEKHPEADKLKLTRVHVGKDDLLNIVCGAPNVAVGQKVIVAPVGVTIYPMQGEPLTLKKAKIRGAESEGMLCAEDEVGLGSSHDGLFILPESLVPGTPLSEVFSVYSDIIYEIGLTPNRSDAMCHWGVARDVCAYLSYHEGNSLYAKLPNIQEEKVGKEQNPISITIENENACKRYCGIYISNVTVVDSPQWLKDRLQAMGQKSINNIVDITNYILHETGQPLHAFDADKIEGQQVIVKTVAKDTIFKTLDEKERKLGEADLMICNSKEPMCIAGVYGGMESGVTVNTKNIFLESAWFHPVSIRRTSLFHQLRTDAASRFEKGADISQTFQVLLHAAGMMSELSGGTCSQATDIYPKPEEEKQLHFHLSFLEKLSGKKYEKDAVMRILMALEFKVEEKGDQLLLTIPHRKNDVHIQADIVEEVMRVDGLDNISIPEMISMSPQADVHQTKIRLREKIANDLAGMGFHEILTNSIVNGAHYADHEKADAVKMLNSLSSELDMMRTDMLSSGLQVIAHNLNHKNQHLLLFEFGKTYHRDNVGNSYREEEHLAIYASGLSNPGNWKKEAETADFYFIKGVMEKCLRLMQVKKYSSKPSETGMLSSGTTFFQGNETIGEAGIVAGPKLKKFDIKQPVFFARINMGKVYGMSHKTTPFKELSKYPSVQRDLALVVDKNISYAQIEQIALASKPEPLKSIELFDVFESEKLGNDKKSMAVSFTFINEQKTMTDQEIDQYMKKLINSFEKEINAEIRK